MCYRKIDCYTMSFFKKMDFLYLLVCYLSGWCIISGVEVMLVIVRYKMKCVGIRNNLMTSTM